MKRIASLLAMLALVFASFACTTFKQEVSVSNLRMAHDQNGKDVTSTFSPSDVIFAVADLKDAPKGTTVVAKWIAVDVTDTEPGLEIQKQDLDVTEDSSSGTIYFQLINADNWPTGDYRVDIYVNDTLSQSLEFNVE